MYFLIASNNIGGIEMFKKKIHFLIFPFLAFIISIILFSCKNSELVTPPLIDYHFNIYEANYSTNNYFIDTLYASTNKSLNLFNKYYGELNPEVNLVYRVKKIEVWKSKNDIFYDRSRERKVNAYLNLPPLSQTKSYSNALSNLSIVPVPGQSETGRFELLSPDSDYTLHPETGYITFHVPVNDQDAIAVAYEVENSDPGDSDDSYYGEFSGPSSPSDTIKNLVLKLIKPAYLKPQYKEAWKLLLRNIYNIGYTNIKPENFYLNIKYVISPNNELYGIDGKSFLTILGLDKSDKYGNPNNDGLFDYRPGITINPKTGDIIFPTLQPFGRNMPSWVPDSLRFNELYDTSKSAAIDYYGNKNKFVITSEY
jgi:hypothetical protein